MIIPDVNLLIYAYNADAPHHLCAKTWWESLLNGQQRVGLPWAVMCGFIRLMTHARVLQIPLPPKAAIAHVQSWLARDCVQLVDPGPKHLALLEQLLVQAGIAGAITTDAHLAALAIEWQAELHSNDHDFARFSGLRWHNPLNA